MDFRLIVSGGAHIVVEVGFDPATLRLITTGVELLRNIQRKEDIIMATLADIQAAVAAETTVEQSVLTLLAQVSADLKAAIAANDPAAMQAIVDQLDANAATMAAAVTANTPAA